MEQTYRPEDGVPGLITKLPDGTDYVMYTPSAKQREFHESEVNKLIAMGNRGGGKSVMLRFDAHMRALQCPGSNLILVRKTYKDLLKSHVYFQGLPWGSLKQEMKMLGGDFHATDYICHYPNGSKLFLSYVGHESDALNLLSAEFLAAYFDELSTIPWEFFIKLCASVRVPKSSTWKPVVRCATNPLGPSTPEILQHFVLKQLESEGLEEEPDYDPNQWGCIKINMADNPHIDQVQYRKDLIALNLPEHIKRAWIDGEYLDEGALFNFRPTKDGKPYHVLPELDSKIFKNARIYRVYDHGYKPDPAYCAWIAHLGNRYIVIHEKLWFETVIADIAAEIKEIDQQLGVERVVATYCDPVLDIKTGQDIRTMKDIFEDNRVPMDCSINNREQFASAVHTALAEEAEPGVPRLQIYNYGRLGCPYMVKAIPMQRFNPKRPLAMADQKHDHPVVALAYFLISHSADQKRAFAAPSAKPWMKPKKADRYVLGQNNVRGN